MRKYLRVTLFAAAFLAVGGLATLVARSMWQQHQKQLLQPMLEVLPGVSQHIRDFRQTKVKDGRKVWEVAASDAQYFDDSDTVVVRAPVLSWYLKDGRRLGLEGDEGRIQLERGDVTRVEMQGNIQVFLADYEVRTERAVYDRDTDLITVPGEVEIKGKGLDLRGRGMDVRISDQQLTLHNDVSMVLQPAVTGNPQARRAAG